MNFFTTKQQSNTDESEAMIHDLEAPLLSEDEKKEESVIIHTAVPLLKTNDSDDDKLSSSSSSLYDDMPTLISRFENSSGSGIVHHVHVSPPCQGYSNASKGNVHVHVSPPCQSFASISKENENNDDDDCDTILIDIDSETTVIDARCNLLNGTYLIGFLLGLILQACSLYAVAVVTPSSSPSSATGSGTSGGNSLGMSVIFALYFFSRYWVLLALLLPPVVCTMSEKFHRSSKARRRANRINKKNKNKNVTTSCLETFFECVRFQFGLLFGSLILLSIVNFYALAKTAPLYMLLAYYGVCVVVSLFALCLLQLFVNQVCANISSVEIIVSYDKDDDNDDNDIDNDDDDE